MLPRLPALVLALLLTATTAGAHPAPFSYLDIRLERSGVELSLVVHLLDVTQETGVADSQLMDPATLATHAPAITALLQSRLRLSVDGRALSGGVWSAPTLVPDRHGLRLAARYDTGTPPGLLELSTLMFPYDPAHQTFVNVYEGGSLVTQAILSRDRQALQHFSGTRQGTLAVIRKFAASGVHHILIGPDHLLFLVGLLLLGGSLRQLALVVTAFTAAHSVTLTLAALDILRPSAAIIEPAIALSIVYVGADNLMVRSGRDLRAWIAFAFGLIHGFGFANVLGEMELPARALGWSLFSFNLGVEIGQLIVVLIVASALAAVRARSARAGRLVAVIGSVLVIAVGTFWFVERVFFTTT